MAWMKVEAARQYAGGIGRRILYKAVASGQLKAARIGAGRSLLFCDSWIDEWLCASAGHERGAHPALGQGEPAGREVAGARTLRLVERR